MTAKAKSAKLTRDDIEDIVKKAGGFEELTVSQLKELADRGGISIGDFIEMFSEAETQPTSFAGSSEIGKIKPSKGFNAAKGSGSLKYEVTVVDDEDHQFLVVCYIPPSFARRDVEIMVEIDPDSPKVNVQKVS